MNNEVRLAAELAKRQLESADGADRRAITQAFKPLMDVISNAEKQFPRFETKEQACRN